MLKTFRKTKKRQGSIMNNSFKYKAISAAILASLANAPTYAAETADAANSVEVIEVTGFKSSIHKAMNAKRFSDGVSDSIYAEDVGKSTDQNIGDALSRVTGVTVQDSGGEGSRISVRGAQSSMNQISMNGVAMTSGLSGNGDDPVADQSVDLSAFSSDIVGSIDVQKTSAADQDEGSLGAVITLNTIKPLDLNERRINAEVQYRYNDFADEADYKVGGTFADKFLDDTVGFIFTISNETSTTRTDTQRTDWNPAAVSIQDPSVPGVRHAHDIATGKTIRIKTPIYGNPDDPEEITGYEPVADPDNEIGVEGPLNVMGRESENFVLAINERERTTANMGLQFRPTESTDIQLDLTYTEQIQKNDNRTLRLATNSNAALNSLDPTADWNGVDLASHTLQSQISREFDGDIRRSKGETKTETVVASLKLNQQITDRLSMDVTAGYSKTDDTTPEFINVQTALWGTVDASLINNVSLDQLEPVSYDCTTADCNFTVGQTNAVVDPATQVVQSSVSKFVPTDISANHLASLYLRDNKSEDTGTSLFVDFDYDLDADIGNIISFSTVEFGGKYNKRVRDVKATNTEYTTGETITDANGVELPLQAFSGIKVKDFLSTEAFPYDNFLDGIAEGPQPSWKQSWANLDPHKALAIASGASSTGLTPETNPIGTRKIETETVALYAKVNFEMLDGDLTGNIGVRYVKDDTTATSYSSITYDTNPNYHSIYDLINDGFADTSKPACAEPIWNEINGNGDFIRADAPSNHPDANTCTDFAITHATFGYQTPEEAAQFGGTVKTHGNGALSPESTPRNAAGEWILPVPTDAPEGTMPVDINRLIDIDYIDGVPQWDTLVLNPWSDTINNVDGTTSPSDVNDRKFLTGMMQWVDRTTVNRNKELLKQYTASQIGLRAAPETGTGGSSSLLPSISLNYKVNEEMMVRFGASQTMTRPGFDDLRPSTEITENNWNESTGNAGNANLQPLKSTNLDLSWEWYYSATDMLAIGLFNKNMTDFPETLNSAWHAKDYRTDYGLTSFDGILMPITEGQMPYNSECLPERVGNTNVSLTPTVECEVFNVARTENGVGAKTSGVELGFNQSFDMLPSVLSGLGLSFNYTFQKSTRADVEGNNGEMREANPMPYTPKHSANTTLFWEESGLQLRLAHRYTGVQFTGTTGPRTAIWQEASSRLDFSTSYELTESVDLTFHALNITDDVTRRFITSREISGDEGNAINGDTPTHRTRTQFKTGTNYRLGIRASF